VRGGLAVADQNLITDLKSEVSSLRQRLAQAETAAQTAEAARAAAVARSDELVAEKKDLQASVKKAEDLLEARDAHASTKGTEAARAQRRLDTLEAQLQKAAAKLDTSEQSFSDLKRKLAQAEAALAQSHTELAAMTRAKQTVEAEKDKLVRRLQDTEALQLRAKDDLGEVKERESKAVKQSRELHHECNTLRERVSYLERANETLEAKISSLRVQAKQAARSSTGIPVPGSRAAADAAYASNPATGPSSRLGHMHSSVGDLLADVSASPARDRRRSSRRRQERSMSPPAPLRPPTGGSARIADDRVEQLDSARERLVAQERALDEKMREFARLQQQEDAHRDRFAQGPPSGNYPPVPSQRMPAASVAPPAPRQPQMSDPDIMARLEAFRGAKAERLRRQAQIEARLSALGQDAEALRALDDGPAPPPAHPVSQPRPAPMPQAYAQPAASAPPQHRGPPPPPQFASVDAARGRLPATYDDEPRMQDSPMRPGTGPRVVTVAAPFATDDQPIPQQVPKLESSLTAAQRERQTVLGELARLEDGVKTRKDMLRRKFLRQRASEIETTISSLRRELKELGVR
jgi:archaellum component FlaC